MGTWPLEQVDVERTSVYRFTLRVDDEMFEFFPEEPCPASPTPLVLWST